MAAISLAEASVAAASSDCGGTRPDGGAAAPSSKPAAGEAAGGPAATRSTADCQSEAFLPRNCFIVGFDMGISSRKNSHRQQPGGLGSRHIGVTIDHVVAVKIVNKLTRG